MNMHARFELLRRKVRSQGRACACVCVCNRIRPCLFLLIIPLRLVMQVEFTALSLVGYF